MTESVPELLPNSACARLLALTVYLADSHDISGFLDLFTEDAVVTRMGEKTVGYAAIRKMMEGRSRERVTRHVLSPPMIEELGEGEARGLAYFVLWEAHADEAEKTPYPLREPTTVGEYHQHYRLTPDGWRISEHKISSVFRK